METYRMTLEEWNRVPSYQKVITATERFIKQIDLIRCEYVLAKVELKNGVTPLYPDRVEYDYGNRTVYIFNKDHLVRTSKNCNWNDAMISAEALTGVAMFYGK